MSSDRNTALKSYLFYIFLLILFAGGLWATLHFGADYIPHSETVLGSGRFLNESFNQFMDGVSHHMSSTIGLLLLQILVILAVARLMGWLFTKMRQPSVIGEIVAGILLGPTLLGTLWPEGFNFLFPAQSLASIELLSQFGLILFMFAVGMELSLNDIKTQFTDSLVLSHAGIFIPFLLSLPLSYFIYPHVNMEGTLPFIPFTLFVGIAMSITAFPVLARIISEQGLSGKPLGKLALSTAAMGDISAWLFLAAIMAITQNGNILSSVYNLIFLLAYLGVMFGLIRPLFKIMGKIYDNTEVVNRTMVGFIFILLIISSYATELLSMHALFGAFIMGLVMPEDDKFRHIITQKVEDVSLMLFLPLFFVSSGLHTHLGLIDSAWMWALLALFVFVAVSGKVGGTYIAGLATGHGSRQSLYLGAFMNTRGLMELVVLSIGLQLGVLPAPIYAVLVLMTIITTVMTQPLVSLINSLYKRREKKYRDPKARKGIYENGRVLLSFGRPESGAMLLQLVDRLLRRGERVPDVTALHITPDVDINPHHAETISNQSFQPVRRESKRLNIPLTTQYEISTQIERLVVENLEKGYDMLVVGGGIKLSARSSDLAATSYRRTMRRRLGNLPVATGEALFAMSNMLRDKMDFFVKNSPCSVAVFVDRDFGQPQNVLMLVSARADMNILPYARTMAQNCNASLSLLPTNDDMVITPDKLRAGEIQLSPERLPKPETLASYDFMLVSYDHWKRLMHECPDLLMAIPSTVILNIRNYKNDL